MLNKGQLVKIHDMLVQANTTIRKSYFGKRYFSVIEQRLDKAKVNIANYIMPKQIELRDAEYQELLGMYERGKGHKETASIRIGKEFTVLYFDVDVEKNPLHILSGHPSIDIIKHELMTGLWNHLLRFLTITDKENRFLIGFDHFVLPKIVTEEGEVTEIYLQKADEERFFELLCDNDIDDTNETTLEVQGLKYDYDFGRKTA